MTVLCIDAINLAEQEPVLTYSENVVQVDSAPGHESAPKTLFLSYSHADTSVAELIEKQLRRRLGGLVRVLRDIRDVRPKESFRAFMQSIGSTDHVIMIVSDSYLKSVNCMYEVHEVLRDRDYSRRITIIVIRSTDSRYYGSMPDREIEAKVFSSGGRLGYVEYWKRYSDDLASRIKNIADPAATARASHELEDVERIRLDLQHFLTHLGDIRESSVTEMVKSGFATIVQSLDQNN